MDRIRKCTVGLVVCGIMALSSCGAETQPKRPIMNLDYLQDENGNTYLCKNGEEQQRFQVEAGSKYKVEISVEKKEGVLNVWIAKDAKKENAVYEGNDIPSSEFVVFVSEEGEYTIWVEAENFVGDYSINFEKSN